MSNPDALAETRASLIHRLQNFRDDTSWQDFFKIYWHLIYGRARKTGLTDAEAQEVVQETLISVAKHMPTFRYDPAIGSFKSWLLTMTQWRITDQFRKRQLAEVRREPGLAEDARTDPLEDLPDPNGVDQNAAWEAEWQTNLVNAALGNLKRQLDPKKMQIFDFYVNREWPPEKIAARFQVSLDQVYQIKHRVTDALRAEVQRLEKEMT